MAVILAKETLAAGDTSTPVDTSAVSNIMIGSDSAGFVVSYSLGSTIVYEETDNRKGARAVLLVKASSVAVRNPTKESIEIEIWA